MKCYYAECVLTARRGTKSCSYLHAKKDPVCNILDCRKIRHLGYYTCEPHTALRYKTKTSSIEKFIIFASIYHLIHTNISKYEIVDL